MKKTAKQRGLGRGLSALLAERPSPEILKESSAIPISKIKPNRLQPRSHFDHDELKNLTDSIKAEGVLMPILVRPVDDGFELIAGERRWRASQAAGLLDIPAVIRDVNDLQALELAIIENEQRDDLTAVESARAYRRLMDEFSYTQQQVAERIGVSRVQVSNIIRLLNLPVSIQNMIEERQLSMGQARPLVGLDAYEAEQLALECVSKGWSARQMEKEAQRAATRKQGNVKEVDADIAALEDELSRTLGLAVTLRCSKSGAGEMKIAYTQPRELDGVLKRLRRAL